MSRRFGTSVFNGLPAGTFDVSVFDVVLNGLTVRGSIVGTRQDMIEALDLYAAGKIKPTYQRRPLEDLNEIFGEMRQGKIDGRVGIEYEDITTVLSTNCWSCEFGESASSDA